MLELTQLDKDSFNHQFLKFRTQYYFIGHNLVDTSCENLVAQHLRQYFPG